MAGCWLENQDHSYSDDIWAYVGVDGTSVSTAHCVLDRKNVSRRISFPDFYAIPIPDFPIVPT